MSKVEVNQVTQQCGTTLTVGGGACKTAVVDATTVTLGRCGGTVSLASGATQSGFGRTGTVDWITTPKVTGDSPITGVTGKGYFLNTTAGTITLNLPAGVAGSIISMADYAATWQTNNVTVTPNGSEKIGGVNASVTLNTEGQSVTLVYIDGVQGWINTMDSTSNVRAETFMAASGGNTTLTVGDYKTHIFTGPGTFCVSAAATCAANNKVDYFVVAGGGSAGGYYGAGGAGGFRLFSTSPGSNSPLNNSGASPNTEVTVTASPYPVTVGGGGTAGACAPGIGPYTGNIGSNSVFSTVTSTGGGFGNSIPGCSPPSIGGPGGSGGSSGYFRSPAGQGQGNTPPVSPSQGNPGGRASYGTAGGGGGAGAAGSNGTCNGLSVCAPQGGPQLGGDGGAGSYIADPFIGPTAPSYGTPGPTGSTRYFAGGGAGGACSAPAPAATAGAGGAGGGGTGKKNPGPFGPAQNATINTGGGGGGSGGGLGGSGIVIIRYRFQ